MTVAGLGQKRKCGEALLASTPVLVLSVANVSPDSVVPIEEQQAHRLRNEGWPGVCGVPQGCRILFSNAPAQVEEYRMAVCRMPKVYVRALLFITSRACRVCSDLL